MTCDVIRWFYLRKPDNRKQWLDVGQSVDLVRQGWSEKQCMISVWWNFERVIHFEIIPRGSICQLRILQCTAGQDASSFGKKKYPAFVNPSPTRQCETRTSNHTHETTKELKVIKLLPLFGYSPDLALSNFHMF